jgi:N-dimethylarginine dimethylaminohydrolase
MDDGFSDLFLMSHPRWDWSIRGRANFLSQGTLGKVPGPRDAMRDWLQIAAAIEEAGGTVVVAPPPPHVSLTGLPYTAEWGHTFRDADGKPALILPKMTPPHRQAEPTYVAGFAAALGWRTFATQARWEGQGDALRIDARRIVHTAGVGAMARTEPGAYQEVADKLSPEHLFLPFRADPWFHGNTFLGVFRPRGGGSPTVLLCPEALEPVDRERLRAFFGDLRVVEIDAQTSRDYATNALQVRDAVIAPSRLPEHLHALWRGLGLRVVELELDALFRSGGGAAVCLTLRLDGIRREDVPAALTFSSQREALARLCETYPLSAV